MRNHSTLSGFANDNAVQQLAEFVTQQERHENTRLLPQHEAAVLDSCQEDRCIAAAVLYMAHDEMLHGDRQEAGRRILLVADALAANDPHLGAVRRFYVG